MKFLSQSKNKHFYYSGKNMLFDTNSENCIITLDQVYDKYTGEEKTIFFYTSGALIRLKTSDSINIFFVKNDGKRLFDISATELNEMENTIYDIDAYACGSGVYVVTEKYDKTKNYDYYLYNGTKIMAKSFDEMKRQVDLCESNIGVYFDAPSEKVKDAPYSKFFLEQLNSGDELNNTDVQTM